MRFQIDDEFLPATLTAQPMNDEEFVKFCSGYPDLFFEMSADGDIIVIAPAYSITGVQKAHIGCQLGLWKELDGRGIVCDSSAGFVLPNGARRSPDASWTLKDRVKQMDPVYQETFWRLCPDFVIELKSAASRHRTLHEKMIEYLANGAQLGWLIDPETRSVSVYRPDRDVETLNGVDSIAGEGPVAGFVLELASVWDPLAG